MKADIFIGRSVIPVTISSATNGGDLLKGCTSPLDEYTKAKLNNSFKYKDSLKVGGFLGNYMICSLSQSSGSDSIRFELVGTESSVNPSKKLKVKLFGDEAKESVSINGGKVDIDVFSHAPMPPCKPVKAESPQQPTVPIQFVWHDGAITRKEYFLGMIGDPDKVENCTVEQIGAVLYVRSKD